jgi:hypothetical protein
MSHTLPYTRRSKPKPKGVFKMAVEFYDVKTKKKVSIDEKNITKVTFKSDSGRVTYGIRGEYDGRKLTKFVSKADWDKMAVKEEK